MNEKTDVASNGTTNVKAVISFILGLTTLFWAYVFPLIGGILGVVSLVLGSLALMNIKHTKQSGKVLAFVGVVCGVLGIVVMLVR